MNTLLLAWQGEQLEARIELESMIALNQERLQRGESIAYGEIAFEQLRKRVEANNNKYVEVFINDHSRRSTRLVV